MDLAVVSSDNSPDFRAHYLSRPLGADSGADTPDANVPSAVSGSGSGTGTDGEAILGHYQLSGKLSEPVNGKDTLRWEEIRSDPTIPEDAKEQFRKVIDGLSLTKESRKELCATMTLLMLERGIFAMREAKATFQYRGHTVVSEWQKQYSNGFRLKVVASSDAAVDDSQNLPDLSLSLETTRENCLQVERALVQSMMSRLESPLKETRRHLGMPLLVSVAEKQGAPEWSWADAYRDCERSETAEEDLRIQLEDMFKRA